MVTSPILLFLTVADHAVIVGKTNIKFPFYGYDTAFILNRIFWTKDFTTCCLL